MVKGLRWVFLTNAFDFSMYLQTLEETFFVSLAWSWSSVKLS